MKTALIIQKKQVTPVVVAQPRRQRRRRGTGSTAQQLTPAKKILQEYANTLRNPFLHGPIALGYDCMVPTTCVTAYYRGALSANTDGSFAILQLPSMVNGLYKNVSGASSATWENIGYSNATQIANNIRTARVISAGIRVYVAQALSDVPGVIFAGSIPESDRTSAVAFTPLGLFNNQRTELGFNTTTALVASRPVDNESYQFMYETVYGFSATATQHSSISFIGGHGFPSSVKFYMEAVLNLEGIEATASSDPAVHEENVQTLSISDYFPTPQTLYNRVRDVVRDPVVLDLAVEAVQAVNPTVGRAAKTVRNIMDRGRHIHSAIRSVKPGQDRKSVV